MDYNKNYYADLGLDKNATDDEIKKSFRKLAIKYHPDKNNGNKDAENRFKIINEANGILSDTKLKQEYDQRSPHGKSYSPFGGFGGFGGFDGFGGSGFEFNFGGNDIFSTFFGQNNPFGFNFSHREEFKENLDVNVNATITLKDIYLNETLTIKYKKYVHCDDCKGTGFDNKSQADTCEICNGTGKHNGKICEYCLGTGIIHSGQCKTCHGEKVILQDAEVSIQNISQLRNSIKNIHRGYGHQSKYYRDKIGNLILTVNVNRDDNYTIINNFELHKNIDIHFQDAIDGKEITFNHIDNIKIDFKLPTKTKNGDILKIKNKGLLINDNNRSDLYLKINIIIDYERI